MAETSLGHTASAEPASHDMAGLMPTILTWTEEDLTRTIQKYGGSFEPIWNHTLLSHERPEHAPKRLRPALAYAVAMGLELELASARPIGEVTELLHGATLFIDDWHDATPTRRGLPAAHEIYGPQRTVLAAVDLTAIAVQRAQETDAQGKTGDNLTALVLEVSHTLCQGQDRDLGLTSEATLDELALTAQQKTAALMMLPMVGAALLEGGQPTSQLVKLLREYADNCGTAFQIHDDLVDADEGPPSSITFLDVISRTAAKDLRDAYLKGAESVEKQLANHMDVAPLREIRGYVEQSVVNG